MLKIPTTSFYNEKVIDFKKLVDDYDAIHLDMTNYYFGHTWIDTERIQSITRLTKEECERIELIERMFYAWDCDSIVVLNPRKIVFHERRK